MSCPGLHCAGCAGGIAVPVVPLAAFLGIEWVVEHLVEVVAVSATCGALSVAAVVFLMRWGNRRDERQAVAWRQMRACEVSHTEVPYALGNGVMGQPYGTVHAPQIGKPITGLVRHTAAGYVPAERPMPQPNAAPALGFRDLHIHLDGMPDAAQAAVIRQALNGRTDQP